MNLEILLFTFLVELLLALAAKCKRTVTGRFA